MSDTDLNQIVEFIHETFNDNRKIKCIEPNRLLKIDKNKYQGGQILITENGEYINLEYQVIDFDESELVKQIEFAEELYELSKKIVSIYLLCPKNVNVTVKECSIKSEAEFTIKLACCQEDICKLILDEIKNKKRNNETLNQNDLNVLEQLPLRCSKEDRNYYRMEYLKIINDHI